MPSAARSTVLERRFLSPFLGGMATAWYAEQGKAGFRYTIIVRFVGFIITYPSCITVLPQISTS